VEKVIEYKASTSKPVVMSLSLGGSSPLNPTSPLCLVFKAAYEVGVVAFVAAGNDNADTCTTEPANCPYVVAVSSADSNDEKSWFSNHGTTCSDITSYGSHVYSASAQKLTALTAMSGTSMSTPTATGVYATIASAQHKVSGGQFTKADASQTVTQMMCSANDEIITGLDGIPLIQSKCGDETQSSCSAYPGMECYADR